MAAGGRLGAPPKGSTSSPKSGCEARKFGDCTGSKPKSGGKLGARSMSRSSASNPGGVDDGGKPGPPTMGKPLAGVGRPEAWYTGNPPPSDGKPAWLRSGKPTPLSVGNLLPTSGSPSSNSKPLLDGRPCPPSEGRATGARPVAAPRLTSGKPAGTEGRPTTPAPGGTDGAAGAAAGRATEGKPGASPTWPVERAPSDGKPTPAPPRVPTDGKSKSSPGDEARPAGALDAAVLAGRSKSRSNERGAEGRAG